VFLSGAVFENAGASDVTLSRIESALLGLAAGVQGYPQAGGDKLHGPWQQGTVSENF